jgi:hypothetical protein
VDVLDAPTDMVSIALDKLDQPWILNNLGDLYSREGSDWILQTSSAIGVAFGSNFSHQIVNVYG